MAVMKSGTVIQVGDFPALDRGFWIPGEVFPPTTVEERRLWLAGWDECLEYHHATTGKEADIYLQTALPEV